MALGRGPQTPVREVMTKHVKYCFEDQDIEEVTLNMGYIQVRRVLNKDKQFMGIIALGDIARSRPSDGAAAALHKISQPGG